MNAPAPAVLTQEAFKILALVELAPSTTRTQERRRARFTDKEIAELADNLKVMGMMLPIIVRPHPRPTAVTKFEIIAGERRWLAAGKAGLVMAPVIVRSIADADLVQFQLTENLQRKTIDQLEEAEGYDELRKTKKINADQVAELLGVSRSTVFNRLKLLDLCEEARKPLDEGKLSPSVALLIARLPDPKMQAKAVKGCLGSIEAQGKFQPEQTQQGPLTYVDAEQYIKEEFTTRIEGTVAINKAKSEGKPVIAGKEAAELWKRDFAGPAGHVMLDDHYWMSGERKSYAAALGDNPPGMVLIQSPHTGAAVKCLSRADAIRIFKEKKLKLPDELTPRQTQSATPSKPDKALSPEAAAKAKTERAKQEAKERREEVEAQLEVDIRIAVFKALRAKTPAKLGKPELLELLPLINDYQLDKELAPRPKSLAGCTERELVRFVIDLLYGVNLDRDYEEHEPMLAAAKRYGVNVAKIKNELTAKAEAILKEEAAAAAAKASKTSINPKEKWPFPTGAKVNTKTKKRK